MDSPQGNGIPASSSHSPPLQNSPFFNYLSSLSPIKPCKVSHVGSAFTGLSFPPAPRVFTSPRISSQREADLQIWPHPQGSSDAVKKNVQVKMLASLPVVFRTTINQPAVEMEPEADSPSGSVEKFLADSLKECGTDSPDLSLKEASNLHESLQSGCSGMNSPFPDLAVDNVNKCEAKETETAATVTLLKRHGENQEGEKSVSCVETVGTDDASKQVYEAAKENDKKPSNKLSDLVFKNVNGLMGVQLSTKFTSTKQDGLQVEQSADSTSLLSGSEECYVGEREIVFASSSGIHHDVEQHPAENGQMGECNGAPQMLLESFQNDQVDGIGYENYEAVSDKKVENQLPYDCKEACQHHRGVLRRCLQFETPEAIRTSGSWKPTNIAPNPRPPASPLDSETLNTSNMDSSRTFSNLHEANISKNAMYKLSLTPFKPSETHIDKDDWPAHNSGSSPLTAIVPPGIGLHLNKIGSVVMVSSSAAKDDLNVKGKTVLSGSYSHVPEAPNDCSVPVALLGELQANLMAEPDSPFTGSEHANIEMDQQESQASAVPNSFANVQTSKLKIRSLKSTLQLKRIEQHAISTEKKRAAQEDASYPEINQMSTKKSRKTETYDTEGEGCKRCNCKKSKCLKLYCDCFAAGVYCAEPCSCRECFNKPEYEDTVLETRQQIESRNPLAFAPKIVQCVNDSPQNSGEDGYRVTPASARHKRGCNCKKSKCLKKYCECYQAGVGCSVGCRCEECKNVFGKKGECGVITEMEHRKVKDVRYEEFINGKQDMVHARSSMFDQKQSDSDHSMLLTPLFQNSNHTVDAPKSHHQPTRYLLSSPESEGSAFSSCGKSSKSPRKSNHNNRFVKAKGNTSLVPCEQELDCQVAGKVDGAANTCGLSPSSQPFQSRAASLEAPDSEHHLTGSQAQLCHSSRHLQVGSLRWRSSPVTPTSYLGGCKFIGESDSDSGLYNIVKDETPDILKEAYSPIKTVKATSPNQKRVSPPQNSMRELRTLSPSPRLRSVRKFILQSVTPFPSLTPYIEPKKNDK